MAFSESKYSNKDIETGKNVKLYPTMTENPQLRWAFIRKVYVILCMQLLLTAGVAATVVFVKPIPQFILHTNAGLAVAIIILVLTLILLWPLHVYMDRHPLNLFLLMLFTVMLSFTVGLTCSLRKGTIILEAAVLTSVVVVALTLYTFWAAKRGQDFNFLGPFLFSALMLLMVASLIQIFFPLGKLATMTIGCISALIFSGYIIYDTDNLIKRYSYDEYIQASIALYLDIINLFLALMNILSGTDD